MSLFDTPLDTSVKKQRFARIGSLDSDTQSHLLCELSDVPVAPPECPKSFHLLPNFWQQMHRRRLGKKTNVTVPSIDIWGLDTHEHDEEEEDDFAPPHRYFDIRVSILFLSRFSLFVFYSSTKVKGIHAAPSPNCRSK